MATQQQIDANRRNAQKSTGPTTPEGRAAVRHNALKHGLTAEILIPSMEDQPEFDRLATPSKPNTNQSARPKNPSWKTSGVDSGSASIY